METDILPQYSVRSILVDADTGKELTCGAIVEMKSVISVKAAYSQDGVFIGSPLLAELLCVNHGIIPEAIPPTETVPGCMDVFDACAIGFSEKEQKWYGWRDPLYEGFTIGSTIVPGNLAYRPKNCADYLEMIWRRYEGEDNTRYKNVKIKQHADCFSVEYDLEEHEVDEVFTDPVLAAQLESVCNNHGIPIPEKTRTRHCMGFYLFPEKFGRGIWQAETLEDAKQMAMDFARGIVLYNNDML